MVYKYKSKKKRKNKIGAKKISRRKNSKSSDLKESLLYIFLGFIIAYFLNVGLGLALGTDTPVVAIFSESMVPTFQKGDMVFVQGMEGGITGFFTGSGNINYEIKKDDIIVFDAPFYKYPIIHRIQKIEDGIITTKGDNNVYADPWKTSKDKIHGKAILKIPLLGWVKVGFFEALKLA